MRVLKLRYAASCSRCGAALESGTSAWWNAETRTATCTTCLTAGTDTTTPAAPTSAPDSEKTLKLRYAGRCTLCGTQLAAGSRAVWDQSTKTARCVECPPVAVVADVSAVSAGDTDLPSSTAAVAPLPPPPRPAESPALVRPDSGVAGASARREYERRKAKREAAIDARWGRFAGVVKFLTDDPQTTNAWAQGASGEARLAKALGARLNENAIALHDRKVPGTRGNIDHIVVAPTGVYIVDAKAYKGRIEKRDVGGWFSTDLRLYVGGRDRTKAVDAMAWQVEAVRKALGADSIPIYPSLCLTDAEWGFFSSPFTLKGVICTWARKLADTLNAPGSYSDEQVVAIAQRLAEKLPPSEPSGS